MKIDVEKYVKIPPINRELYNQSLITFGGNILVSSNVKINLQQLVSKNIVADYNVNNYEGKILAIVDEKLFSDLGITRYPESGGYITKESVNYSEKMENIYYQIGNRQININHIPFRSISDYNISDNIKVIICPDLATLYYLLPTAIKNVVGRCANRKGYLSLHCAAVEKNGAIYAMVGRGRSGKSTLYINLLENGFNPLNDDVVFLKAEGTEIEVRAVPLFAKFRLTSLPFIKNSISLPQYNESMTLEQEVYIDCETRYERENKLYGKLETIIFPKINVNDNYFEKVLFSEKKKVLFREIVSQQTMKIDDNLLNLYNNLQNISMYEFGISPNVQQACELMINSLKI